MSLEPDARPPGQRPPEEYGIDDLVRHEKRQTWFVAVLLLGAVVVTIGRQWMQGPGASDRGPAPVSTGASAPVGTGRE